MRVIVGDEVQTMIRSLEANLPARVLSYISMSQPCHPLHLRRQVAAWFPGSAGEQAAERLEDILQFFEQRGDIFIGPRGVLRCMPAYCIADGTDPTAILFGDPNAEVDTTRILTSAGGRLVAASTESGNGLVRHLELGTPIPQKVVEDLKAIGLRFFGRSDLLSRIPQTTDIEMPAPGLFIRPSVVGGAWQHYDPTAPKGYQDGRWVALEDWQEACELLRWAPHEATDKPWLRRHFLHMPGELVLEIPRDMARWWQFALDDQLDCRTVWTYYEDSERLVIGGGLPQAVSQVLQLLSTHPPTYDRFDRCYRIPRSQFPMARDLGEKHLRVRLTVR